MAAVAVQNMQAPPLAVPHGAGAPMEAAQSGADAAEAIVRARFAQFLRGFAVDLSRTSNTTSEDVSEVHEYIVQVDNMAEMDQSTLHVDFAHLYAFDHYLATTVQEEYYRFEPSLRGGLQDVVRERHPDFALFEGEPRDFFVAFHNMMDKLHVRELRCAQVGQLTSFSGTVTRTSEVRPELLSGTFRCEDCGALARGVIQQFKYTTPSICNTPECGNRNKWQLVVERSRFADWQRVRVQENADEIPPGSMPRSVDVILRHAAVERAKAGDKVTFTGCLVVVPDVGQLMKAGSAPRSFTRPAPSALGAGDQGVSGLKDLGVRDLTYRLSFIAYSVNREGGALAGDDDEGASGGRPEDEFSEDERAAFRAALERNQGTFYNRMARCIAPTVFGHEEVKRGILLMLLGGVHKTTSEGIRLRGDINVCIVGDPSTAKSQFLKYVVKFLPRAVYTSGKASSAAGLTASVARDRDTGEFTIEAGALMLADNGVCCIDEFDKMDPADQVAIHEAMEQQTISITKAGIQATLNARASILAAANPVMGRYDRSRTLRQNVAISPPIMSRFDLFFVVLDDCDEVQDYNIARHIVQVHQHRETPEAPEFDTHFLRRYVRYARTLKPVFDSRAAKAVESCFRRLRQSDAAGSAATSYRITVRQLESMIRLAEGLARLHLDTHVRESYVLEAFRLLRRSVLHVESGSLHLGAGGETRASSHSTRSPGRSVATGSPARSTPGRATPKHDDNDEGEEEAEKHEVTISRAELDAMRIMLLAHLEEAATPENGGALKEEELVGWFLETLEQRGRQWTPAELEMEAERVRLVIDYLISTDRSLVLVERLEVRTTVDEQGNTVVEQRIPVPALSGDTPEQLAAQDPQTRNARLIAAHPDAAIPSAPLE